MVEDILKQISSKCKQANKDLDIVYIYLNEKQKKWNKFKRCKIIKPPWMKKIIKKELKNYNE